MHSTYRCDALSNTKTIKNQLKLGGSELSKAFIIINIGWRSDELKVYTTKKFAFSFVQLNLLNNHSGCARWQNAMTIVMCVALHHLPFNRSKFLYKQIRFISIYSHSSTHASLVEQICVSLFLRGVLLLCFVFFLLFFGFNFLE